jgi:hypothetical protein
MRAGNAAVVPKRHSLLVRGTMLAAIAVTVAFAVFLGRTSAGASFLFAAFAPAAYPWYFVWGLPYAALSADTFAFVPIALPFLSNFANNELAHRLPMQFIFWPFALASAAVFVAIAVRRHGVRALKYTPHPVGS